MYFLARDLKSVCLTEAVMKIALSTLNSLKGDKLITNSRYVEK